MTRPDVVIWLLLFVIGVTLAANKGHKLHLEAMRKDRDALEAMLDEAAAYTHLAAKVIDYEDRVALMAQVATRLDNLTAKRPDPRPK